MVSAGHQRLNQIRELSNITSFKTRLQLANSLVWGSISYGLPILMNSDKKLIMKLHKLIILTAKYVIGSPCLCMSTKNIMLKCNWMSLTQRIIFSSLSLFRKVMDTECPLSIYELYIVNVISKEIYDYLHKKKTKVKDYNRFLFI